MSEINESAFLNVNIGVNDGGYFRAKDVDWSMKKHVAGTNKFYFITSGRCYISIEDVEYEAKAGDWFLIPCGVNHSYHHYPGENFEKFWIHFDTYPNRDFAKSLGLTYFVKVDRDEKVKKLFMNLTSKIESNRLTDMLSVKAVSFELLVEYLNCQGYEKSAEVVEMPPSLPMIFSYINNNLSKVITNKSLAEISHMHPTHFIRFFKKETGQTPQEYISVLRMNRAKHLLESTELQISEIAERLAFYDSMHFSKMFKKRYSISPTAYRKFLKNPHA